MIALINNHKLKIRMLQEELIMNWDGRFRYQYGITVRDDKVNRLNRIRIRSRACHGVMLRLERCENGHSHPESRGGGRSGCKIESLTLNQNGFVQNH